MYIIYKHAARWRIMYRAKQNIWLMTDVHDTELDEQ